MYSSRLYTEIAIAKDAFYSTINLDKKGGTTMQKNAAKNRYCKALLAYRLEFGGRQTNTQVARKRKRIAFAKLKRIADGKFLLGKMVEIENLVDGQLIVDHGWRRVDGSLYPPDKVLAAIKMQRMCQVNPRLTAQLTEFSHMSPTYREAVARGALSLIPQLP